MQGPTAFLPGVPLRTARKDVRASQSHSSPCCSSSGPSSRRRFLRKIVGATTTILLSGSIQANAQPGALAQAKPRSKPRKVAWGYAAENGPASWSSLSEEWAICDTGTEQSPIALSYREAGAPGDTPRPTLTTAPGKIVVRMREVNPWAANKSLILERYIQPPPPLVGDAPPVDVYKPPPPLAVITLSDVGTYVFRSCHFHVGGSEHVIEGNRGVMETHFIFERSARAPPQEKPSEQSADDPAVSSSGSAAAADIMVPAAAADTPSTPQTIVVGMLGTPAESSAPWLQELFVNFPLQESEAESRPSAIVMDMDFGEVFPDLERSNFYTYDGSLTTPPGTEGVYWLVLGDRIKAAKGDLLALIGAQNGPNVRPLQPLNGRKVTRFPAAADPTK